MNLFGNLFGNSNKKEEITKDQRFFDIYLSDGEINNSLLIVDRVVNTENYLFTGGEDGNEEIYYNDNLKEAIEIGKDVQKMRQYLDNKESYEGVELNSDVLKTTVSHFLNRLKYYLFFAFYDDVRKISLEVGKTPIDMLRYILTERAEKIEEDLNKMFKIDQKLALRILEYDMLFKKAKLNNLNYEFVEPEKFINEYEKLSNQYFESDIDEEKKDDDILE